MEKLKANLDALVNSLPDAETLRAKLSELYSVYPFNEFEYVISTLLGRKVLTLDQYQELRDGYIERNMFL